MTFVVVMENSGNSHYVESERKGGVCVFIRENERERNVQ